jgi:hypothetical protein
MTIYYWIESFFRLYYCSEYIEEGVLRGHMACAGRKEARAGFWWANLKKRRSLRRTKLRKENNIKRGFKVIGCEV